MEAQLGAALCRGVQRCPLSFREMSVSRKHKFSVEVYGPPDKDGKSGFMVFWKDPHTGRERGQVFRMNVDAWMAEKRAEGHEVEFHKQGA